MRLRVRLLMPSLGIFFMASFTFSSFERASFFGRLLVGAVAPTAGAGPMVSWAGCAAGFVSVFCFLVSGSSTFSEAGLSLSSVIVLGTGPAVGVVVESRSRFSPV